MDQRTGRIDTYDTKSDGTNYGIITNRGTIDLYDGIGNRVGSGKLK